MQFAVPDWLETHYPGVHQPLAGGGKDEEDEWLNPVEVALQVLTRYRTVQPVLSPLPAEAFFADEPAERHMHTHSAHVFRGAETLPSGVRSVSFCDTLQLLALVTDDGQFSLCTLSGETCCVRTIATVATTEGSSGGASPTSTSNNASARAEPPEVAAKLGLFSGKGGLLAVALGDGSVLLSRVERFTSGARAGDGLRVMSGLENRRNSFRLDPAERLDPADAAELAAATLDIAGGAEGLGGSGSFQSDVPGGGHAPDTPRSAQQRGIATLAGVEIHQLHSLSLGPYLAAGGVTCLCFSDDGHALAVGHEGALALWSTDDGTRLSCSATGGAGVGGSGGGGVRGLAWGYHGYRLLAVAGSGMGSPLRGPPQQQERILVYDLLRHAGSAVSGAPLCLQDSTRVVTLEARPWDSHSLYWRVLPCHGGYLASNAPLQHERELEVCGLCWWGEEAVIALARQGSMYWLRLYPRTHLDDASLLLAPLRLPVGMKPAFFSAMPVTRRAGSEILVLVASQRSYLVYRFSQTPAGVTSEVAHQGTLPHVQPTHCTSAATTGGSGGAGSGSGPSPAKRRQWRAGSAASALSLADEGRIGAPRRLFLVPAVVPPLLGILDFDGNLAVVELEGGCCRQRRSFSRAKALARQQRRLKREAARLIEEAYSEEYQVWCPALQLELPDGAFSEDSLDGGTDEALALDPHAYADPESMALGLLARKGAMVVCRPRDNAASAGSTAVNGPPPAEPLQLPPCYEMRTRLRPLLHLLGSADPPPHNGAAAAAAGAVRGFDVAASILAELKRDAALAEAVPDTLELLLRACLEGRHLANEAQKGPAGDATRAQAAAVLSGALRLCALARGCFLEVVARVSRKMEPDWYALLFPLLLGGEGGYEGAHPTHLLHACLEQGRLATAAWFLPLVSDHAVSAARSRSAPPHELEALLPPPMLPLTGAEWSHGLSHALCCCLLLRCLEAPHTHALLPEVWLFACKRERSAASPPQSAVRISAAVTAAALNAAIAGAGGGAAAAAAAAQSSAAERGGAGGGRAATPQRQQRKATQLQVSQRPPTPPADPPPSLLWRIGRTLLWGGGSGPNTPQSQPSTPVDAAPLSPLSAAGTPSHTPSRQRMHRGDAASPAAYSYPSPRVSAAASVLSTAQSPRSDAAAAGSAPGSPGSPGAWRRLSLADGDTSATSTYARVPGRSAAAVLAGFVWRRLTAMRAAEAHAAFCALALSSAGRDAGVERERVMATLRVVARSGAAGGAGPPQETMAHILQSFLHHFKTQLPHLLHTIAVGRAALPPPPPPLLPAAASVTPAVAAAPLSLPPESEAAVAAVQWLEVVRDLAVHVRHMETALVAATLLRDAPAVSALLGAAPPSLKAAYSEFLQQLLPSVGAAAASPTHYAPEQDAPAPEGTQEDLAPESAALLPKAGSIAGTSTGASASAAANGEVGVVVALQQWGGQCLSAAAAARAGDR
ncbi:hypothetical protein JKP88DRAFT_349352 [Tribonema minus]|uniref:Ribosome control protein 1 domain-containing protein n=1 Tax=Tribonema minus TaxID=303371 RepID=A0A835YSR2_9STRA|nr:hypothetical protein JKP88DRAFT_349352 [Tribonema minus]